MEILWFIANIKTATTFISRCLFFPMCNPWFYSQNIPLIVPYSKKKWLPCRPYPHWPPQASWKGNTGLTKEVFWTANSSCWSCCPHSTSVVLKMSRSVISSSDCGLQCFFRYRFMLEILIKESLFISNKQIVLGYFLNSVFYII